MIFNKSRNKKIIAKTKVISSAWDKLRGLIFEDPKKFDYGLVFVLDSESKIGASIHMMFVFFAIDVLFLDRNKKVVDVVEGLRPFTPNCTPKKAAKYFIELPAGKAKGTRVGDELEWE